MSPTYMTALRLATFICHTVPGVRLRLREGDRILAEVGWDVGCADGISSAERVLRPCQLRAAVAQAWEHQRAGRRLAMLGLPEGVDPAIDVGVRGETIQHPGGLLTVAYADRWIHAFGVTLDADQVREAIACSDVWAGDSTHSPPAAAATARIDLHHDELLGVTLVWTETDPPAAAHPAAESSSATLEMMRRLLAACAVAEFDAELRELV